MRSGFEAAYKEVGKVRKGRKTGNEKGRETKYRHHVAPYKIDKIFTVLSLIAKCQSFGRI